MAEWIIPEDPQDVTFRLIIKVSQGDDEDEYPVFEHVTDPDMDIEISRETFIVVFERAQVWPQVGTYVMEAKAHGVHMIQMPSTINENQKQWLLGELSSTLEALRRQVVEIVREISGEQLYEISCQVVRSCIISTIDECPFSDGQKIPALDEIALVDSGNQTDFSHDGFIPLGPGLLSVRGLLLEGVYQVGAVKIKAGPPVPLNPMVVTIGLLRRGHPLMDVVHRALIERVQAMLPQVYQQTLEQMAAEAVMTADNIRRTADLLIEAGDLDRHRVSELAKEHDLKEREAFAQLKAEQQTQETRRYIREGGSPWEFEDIHEDF